MKRQTSDAIAQPQRGRPDMPAGYGLHAASEGLLPWRWVEEWLAKARNYWMATTRPDSRPHVMPVWGLWLDGVFYFGTGRQSRKARNLAQNPNLVVHLESGDEAVILEGDAQEVTDAGRLTRYADAYDAKYDFRPDVEDATDPTFAVRPRVVFGWLESDFPATATRWVFGEAAK